MIPISEHTLLAAFNMALAAGALAAAWSRHGSPAEDDMVVGCHGLVLDAVADADATRTVECVTGRNWRDQVSVQDAEELNRERELRTMQNRN